MLGTHPLAHSFNTPNQHLPCVSFF